MTLFAINKRIMSMTNIFVEKETASEEMCILAVAAASHHSMSTALK